MNDADLRAAFPASREMFTPEPVTAPDPAMVAAFPASPSMFGGAAPPAQPVAASPPAAPAATAPPPSTPPADDPFPNSPTMARPGAAPGPTAPAFVPPAGIAADDPGFQAFTKLATEAGIKPDAASAMLKMHADALAAADYGRAEQATKWAEEARADPDIGGARFDATLTRARSVLDRFGDRELRDALARSGLGNHKGVIRALARIADALQE